jgi:ATP-dependent Zn protease
MRTFLIWLLFIGLFVMVLMHSRGGRKSQEIDFSEFIAKALPAAQTPDGPPPPTQVESVKMKGDRLEGVFVSGEAFTTVGDLKDFQKDLIARGVKVSYESQEVGLWVTILSSWLPMLLFVFLFVVF